MGFIEPADDYQPIPSETIAKIVAIGVGGAGGNAVERMIDASLCGVDFVTVNTDAQAIEKSASPTKLTIGPRTTFGLGAGGNPEKGRKAADEDRERIEELIGNADMVFITAGMGGGTGTGAAPVIAEIAKKSDALTIAIVTKPFEFEGRKRLENAQKGIEELQAIVDTLIVIPNQRLLSIVERQTSLKDAFSVADEILHQAVRNISDLIVKPWEINLDFADVREVLSGVGGDALIGIGEAEGENRAIEAARQAITNPMLEDVSIEGSKGVLLSIAGSSNLTMYEVHEAASLISKAAGGEANFIFGTAIDETLGDSIRIGVIAAGFKRHQQKKTHLPPIGKTQKKRDPELLDIFGDDSVTIPSPEPITKKHAPEFKPTVNASDDYFTKPDRETSFEKPEKIVNISQKKDFETFDPTDYDIPAFMRSNNKKKETN